MARTPKSTSTPEAPKPAPRARKPAATAAKTAPPAAAAKPARRPAAAPATAARSKPAAATAARKGPAPPAERKPARATKPASQPKSAKPVAPVETKPARRPAAAAPAKPSRATAAKPAAGKASARKPAATASAGRPRTALGSGNAQVKPRATAKRAITPDVSKVAEALAAAEPKRPRTRKRAAPISADRLELLVTAARKSLEDDKAEDIKVLDVTGRASFTDRIIIATGLADRQIQAMATHLEEALAKEGLKLKRNAIEASPEWVLIDCGDMVIHLFKPEARDTFRLEKMWGDDSPKADSGSGYEPT